MSCDTILYHTWHEFKFGSDTINYRICKKCFTVERKYSYVDDFQQIKWYWSKTILIVRELSDHIKNMRRDLKINSIDDNK
jgi:predicted nucleic acid-binding protein